MSKRVQFLASIPPLQSAFTVDGAGGMRMKLDLDEMQIGALGDLLGMRGKLLKVTIEVQESPTHGSTKTQARTARRPTDMADG